MDYDAIVTQALTLLQREQRLSYRVLKLRLQLNDDTLEALKEDLIYAKKLAVDEDGRVLVWTGETGTTAPAAAASTELPARAPLTYTPPYLAEKILTSRRGRSRRVRTQRGQGMIVEWSGSGTPTIRSRGLHEGLKTHFES